MKIKLELFIASLSAFVWLLSAWEALVLISRGRVRRLMTNAKDKALAGKLDEWLDNRASYIMVFRVLTLSALAAGVAAGVSIHLESKPESSPILLTGTVILGTFVLVVAAELVAKSIVLFFDIPVLRMTMPVIKLFRLCPLLPLVWLLGFLQHRFEEWRQEDEEEKATAEDEIMSWVEKDSSRDNDPSPIEENEKQMIRGIFDLDDTPVREIMTPRVDLTALDMESSIADARQLIIDSGHSRIPTYAGSVDEIRGIIYAKDFLDGEADRKTIDELAHKPIFIPETKAVGDLLREFQRERNHFAVVIDEYGGTSGVITLEDIIEEIVGEIHDEYDDEYDDEPSPAPLPDGFLALDARTLIADVNDLLDIKLPENEDVDTIGGLVCGALGRIPAIGDETTLDGQVLAVVTKADSRRVITLKLKVIHNEC